MLARAALPYLHPDEYIQILKAAMRRQNTAEADEVLDVLEQYEWEVRAIRALAQQPDPDDAAAGDSGPHGGGKQHGIDHD